MVSASDRQAGPRRARRPRPAGKLGQAGRESAAGDGRRLRRRQGPWWPCRNLRDDAGRAAEGEPESQMGLRQGPVQAAERGRTAVPMTQGLPAHLHAVGKARRDVSGLSELGSRRRNDIRFSINRP